MLCIDCGQPIDPDFIKIGNVERCADCTVIAFWQFIMGDSTQDDKLSLCPDCGEPWPVTETIRADGSLGCPCQELVLELGLDK